MNDYDDSGYKKRPGGSWGSRRQKIIKKELSSLRASLESRHQKSEPLEKINILDDREGYVEDALLPISKYGTDSSLEYLQNKIRNDIYGKLKREDTSLVHFLERSYNLSKRDSETVARALKPNIDAAVESVRSGKNPSLEPIFKAVSNLPTPQFPALVLPDAPPKYPYAPRMEGGIVKYLEDNWAPYIKAGTLTRPDLRRIDPAAYKALENWLSMSGNTLPDTLQVPTKKDALDREIALLGGEDRIRRLASALASRQRRRTPS